MSYEHQVPRNCLAWLLIAQALLFVPHAQRLPVWVLAVFVICALWRVMVFQGRWSFPGIWIKAILAVASFGGVLYSYRTLIGLEPTVALLLAAFALKVIELRARRDVYIVLFLSYFVVITAFLFNQEIPVALYLLMTVVVITAALIALHQPSENRFHFAPLRKSAVLCAQSLPLMIVLFFIFPRFGPLWSVQLKSHSAKTGVSDSMTPGAFGELSRSTELAFRVVFRDRIPSKSEMYWRGLVLSRFDGRAWTPVRWHGFRDPSPEPLATETGATVYDYEVFLEAHHRRWLYAISYFSMEGVRVDNRIHQSVTNTLYSYDEIGERFVYRVRSNLGQNHGGKLIERARKITLELPEKGNSRSRALALRMRAEAGSDRQYIDDLLQMFRSQDFYYTLKPPLLRDNIVDEFLFETRRGFCEHYANAFTYMVRAAGIPANVVAGYQGGEVNPRNNTVLVRQFNAHAWSEVWLDGEGWVRFDPTAAVSPTRIEMGLEEALAAEGSFLEDTFASPLRFRGLPWLDALRYQWDHISYVWHRLVLNYNSRSQQSMLSNLLGKVTPTRLLAVLFGVAGLVSVIAWYFLFYRYRDLEMPPPAVIQYRKLLAKLARAGLHLQAGEGPNDFIKRCGEALPEQADELRNIARLFSDSMYAAGGGDVTALKAAIAKLRLAAVPTPA